MSKKGQIYLPQEREAATSAEKLGISHENVKMAAKRDAAAEHGEAQHVTAAEALRTPTKQTGHVLAK